MFTYSDDVINHFKNIELELNAIKHSFKNTTEKALNSFKPFAVLFEDPEHRPFAITSRPVSNEHDYYTAISEMLFAYSAIEANGVLLAIDATKNTDSTHYDLLEVYAACDHFCTIFSMPYSVTDNSLVWHEDKFNAYTIEKLEKAYDTNGQLHATLEIYEALYLHTHLSAPVFEISKLKSFYDRNNFEYVSLTTKKSDVTSA